MAPRKNIDPLNVRLLLRTCAAPEVARLLGCDRSFIYRIIKQNDIPYNYRPGARTDLTL